MSTYFIVPEGTPSHASPLQARLDTILTPPFMPPGHTIQWRYNGIPIKEGPTDDPFFLSINTNTPGDFKFDGTFTGAVVDFLIDEELIYPPPASLAVILSNNLPTLSGAGPLTDAYNRTTGRPTFVWTYSDIDGDPQYNYRVRVGSAPLGTNFYDSGILIGQASALTIPNISPAIPAGVYFWTIEVSDGQKVNPSDPDVPEPPRVMVQATGVAYVNTPPVVSNVLVDGVSGGLVPDLTPTISWTYSDVDGQPQQQFRVVVTSGANTLWDSGILPGSQTSIPYNYNLTGQPLVAPANITIAVFVYDTFTFSSASISVTAYIKPKITLVTVQNKVNPQDIVTQQPFFNWTFIPLDSGLSAYEIRVGDSSANLGTDAFQGDIWQPGVIVTPESYKTQFNFDGSAFGCSDVQMLQSNVIYYFQVQIYDLIGGKSDWATGLFKLNTPPTAANVRIIPAAPFHNQDLLAAYDFVDDPGEVEDTALTQIKWFQNGNEVPSVRNQRTVPSSLLVPGDMWYFTVRPNDGVDFSLVAYPSAPVTILDRAPQASALVILPGAPRTTDDLQAVFATSDPDGDQVQVTIRWYKNGIEQGQLLNSATVPSSLTTVGDSWYFTILPFDGFLNGALQTSASVTILNTPPRVLSITVDAKILPVALADQNPTIAWVYQDDDAQPQQKFEVVVGTQPVRTKPIDPPTTRALPVGSAGLGSALACGSGNGIIASAKSDGQVVAGNELFDSGVIVSGENSFRYVTSDFTPPTIMDQIAFETLNGYTLGPDLQTLMLRVGASSGTASGKFPGQTAFYNIEMTFVKETDRSSTYNLIVDSAVIGSFTSSPGSGTDTFLFPAVRVNSGSSIVISGAAATRGARAEFQRLAFTPITQLDLNAADFDTLSGYLPDGTGGIKLAGLVGTASTKFAFPSGTYDIEFVYVTETNGSPSVSLMVGSLTILNFNYEVGAGTRSRFIQGVSINTGDVIKISGTRNLGAQARVKKIIFRPTITVAVGSALKPGIRYFASVRVFDGMDWSDWETTAFVMKGSAWVSNVSNQAGWTIEFRVAVTPTSSGTSGAKG